MADIIRHKKNWEAEFSNITYGKAKKILEDKNVKEISVSKKIGISQPIYIGDIGSVKLDVRAFDDNALKNENMILTKGRFPKTDNEILVSKHKNFGVAELPKNLNEKVTTVIHGEKKIYTVVGIVEEINFDDLGFGGGNLGAITYLSNELKDSESIVNVTILSNNIQKIYNTARNLANEFNIQEKVKNEENRSEEEMMNELIAHVNKTDDGASNLKFNEELLMYECVINSESEFAKVLFIIR